jgi:hypothetical protein
MPCRIYNWQQADETTGIYAAEENRGWLQRERIRETVGS